MTSGVWLGVTILAIGVTGIWYLRRKYKQWKKDQDEMFVTTARFFDWR
jgi:hypothetical protein